MSQNFHNSLHYASHMGLFDPNISTGPTVLIPASFFISPIQPLLPRIITAIYSFITIFLVLRYLLNPFKEKVIYLLLLFLLPLYFFFSAHLLGEIPAFSLFLASLILFHKKIYFFSAVCLMLSILTKNIYILGIVAPIYLYFMQERKSIRIAIPFFLGFFLPLVLWEIYHFASFGYNSNTYIASLISIRHTTEILATPSFVSIGDRITMLEYVFNSNGYLVLFFVLFICCFTLFYLSKKIPMIASLAFFALVYFLFFLFADNTTTYRHMLPTILSLSIVIPTFLTHLIKKWNKNYLFIFSLIGIVLIINIYTNVITGNTTRFALLRLTQQGLVFHSESIFPPVSPDPLLIAQENLAKYIHYKTAKQQLTGYGWWNAPEIAYLADRKIERNPYTHTSVYFVTDTYALILNTAQVKNMLAIPNKKIFDATGGYALYKKL